MSAPQLEPATGGQESSAHYIMRGCQVCPGFQLRGHDLARVQLIEGSKAARQSKGEEQE
jgi:hypothetical protein